MASDAYVHTIPLLVRSLPHVIRTSPLDAMKYERAYQSGLYETFVVFVFTPCASRCQMTACCPGALPAFAAKDQSSRMVPSAAAA